MPRNKHDIKKKLKLFIGILIAALFVIAPIYLKSINAIQILNVFPVENADGIQTSEGVTLQTQMVETNNQTYKVNYVSINLKKAKVKIISPEVVKGKQGNSYTGYNLIEYLELGKYKVVHSAGFLSSWSPPYSLGYVKIQGKEINRVHDTWLTKGLFCSNGNKVSVASYSSPEQFSQWQDCIQAGPILIKNKIVALDTSKNTYYVTRERHEQSFVCQNSKDQLLMGVTTSIDLVSLSAFLALDKSHGGLECTNAISLSGKNMAGMAVSNSHNKTNYDSYGHTDILLPNIIAVQ